MSVLASMKHAPTKRMTAATMASLSQSWRNAAGERSEGISGQIMLMLMPQDTDMRFRR